jgi:urease accessory protein
VGVGTTGQLAFSAGFVINATTDIEVGVDCRGRTVVRRMHCEVPMLARVIDEPGPALTLAMVNGAAGPLGGDRLHFKLSIGSGAQVTVGSVAAAIAQPGPCGEPSELLVDLVVGDDAALEWHPQPTISVVGSDHRVFVRLMAASSSTIRMREGVSLGRSGEPPGRFTLRERVTIDNVAVLDHETAFAPGPLLGPGAQGNGRCMTSEVVIGSMLPAPAVEVNGSSLRSTVHLSPICALVTTRS